MKELLEGPWQSGITLGGYQGTDRHVDVHRHHWKIRLVWKEKISGNWVALALDCAVDCAAS
jgi:hypothetical protein